MIVSAGTVFVSFVLSVVLVTVVLKISHKKAWYDRIDDRKKHKGQIPRLGGMGFAAAFIAAAFFITLLRYDFSPDFMLLFPFLGLIITTCLGVADDFRMLSPKVKLLVQCGCALLVVIPGYTFNYPFFLRSTTSSDLEWIKYPVTFFWIAGMTNAINLLDGVDGLAGGVSLLIALFFAFMLYHISGFEYITLIFFCLAAVLLGFLVFNAPLPKARIFMGDGGAYFLGYVLAILPLLVSREDAGNTLPVYQVGALVLIPVYDTIAAIWRRLRDRRRVDSPDASHIHHKLINLGLSSRQVDLTLYSLQIFLGGMVILSTRHEALILVFLGSAYFGCLAFFAAVHFMNRRLIKSKKNEQGPED